LANAHASEAVTGDATPRTALRTAPRATHAIGLRTGDVDEELREERGEKKERRSTQRE
jgi:hypothetical protein